MPAGNSSSSALAPLSSTSSSVCPAGTSTTRACASAHIRVVRGASAGICTCSNTPAPTPASARTSALSSASRSSSACSAACVGAYTTRGFELAGGARTCSSVGQCALPHRPSSGAAICEREPREHERARQPDEVRVLGALQREREEDGLERAHRRRRSNATARSRRADRRCARCKSRRAGRSAAGVMGAWLCLRRG